MDAVKNGGLVSPSLFLPDKAILTDGGFGYRLPVMNLRELLETYQDEIEREWVRRIHTEVSERYSKHPVEEIVLTVSEATGANFAVLVEGDFSKIDIFIEKLARMRVNIGFSLSEVQGAFDLYRAVLIPILLKELDAHLLPDAIKRLNDCLSHAIRKFSDFFESLHEKTIRDYAEDLERVVEKRTRELTESEIKYRMLVEEINDGFFITRKGVVVFANKSFCDMHGYTTAEVIGRPYLDFVAPGSFSEVSRLHEQRMSTGEARDQYVYLRRCKDGRELYSENRVKLITYLGKISTAGICRDITERMELEKQHLKLVKLENERKTIALTTLRQLMVTLSHYLLNANTIIGGMARRSMRAGSEAEKAASLEAIWEQTNKTESVIAALKKLTEIKTADYTHESHTLMIDLTNEIERTLAKTKQAKTSK